VHVRSLKSILIALVLIAAASASVIPQTPAKRTPAEALVSDLYRRHAQKRGPFYQTRSRALLLQYFTRNLADLIWKDRVSAKGEVGALDGDPLYNAQDMKITHFVVHRASYQDKNAEVKVTFENFGKRQEIIFVLVTDQAGWKIANIKYQDGTSLVGIFKTQS
jgi:Protein of unknown function (DUF3828)